jgi:hypothetical protein
MANNGNGESQELTAQLILSAQDIRIERVEVPEWGGHIYVRTIAGTEREKYIESIREVVRKGKKQEVNIILAESGAKLLQKTLCDKNGALIFSENDISALGQKSSKALQRCIDASAEINGLSEDAMEEAKND